MSNEDCHRSEIAEDIQDLDTKLDFLEQSPSTGGLLGHPLLLCLLSLVPLCNFFPTSILFVLTPKFCGFYCARADVHGVSQQFLSVG
jgi:hypothetical protein